MATIQVFFFSRKPYILRGLRAFFTPFFCLLKLDTKKPSCYNENATQHYTTKEGFLVNIHSKKSKNGVYQYHLQGLQGLQG